MGDETIRIVTDIDKICRTCLSLRNSDDLRYLFENSLGSMLQTLIDRQVAKDDGLPGYICNECALTLDVASNFREQCLKSEDHLRNVLLPSNTVLKLNENDYRTFTVLADNSTHSENVRILNSPHKEVINIVSSDGVHLYHNDLDNTESHSYEEEAESKEELIESATNQSVIIKKETCNIDNNLTIIASSNSDTNTNMKAETELTLIVPPTFSCSECSKTFRFENNLKTHLIRHGKNIGCGKCGKEFRSECPPGQQNCVIIL